MLSTVLYAKRENIYSCQIPTVILCKEVKNDAAAIQGGISPPSLSTSSQSSAFFYIHSCRTSRNPPPRHKPWVVTELGHNSVELRYASKLLPV